MKVFVVDDEGRYTLVENARLVVTTDDFTVSEVAYPAGYTPPNGFVTGIYSMEDVAADYLETS